MCSDIEVQDFPTAVADHEEAVEHAEGHRRHGKEIHRGDRLTMVVEKGQPALA
jgi:hypothetical protein